MIRKKFCVHCYNKRTVQPHEYEMGWRKVEIETGVKSDLLRRIDSGKGPKTCPNKIKIEDEYDTRFPMACGCRPISCPRCGEDE